MEASLNSIHMEFFDHKPYTHMSKLQLTILLAEVERTLAGAIEQAKTSSREYSTDSVSYLPFEVGHLSGSIKHGLRLLEAHKK